MKNNFTIFIIFHDTINIQYYNESILGNFVFVNVKKDNKNKYPKLNIINLHDFKEFTPLGSYYAESEVIYNVYRNSHLIENVDYIGFLHHDIDCSPLTNDIIQKIITENKLISFETHLFQNAYDSRILMDEKKPNVLYGKGINCFETIFNEFNSFYNTQFSTLSIYQSQREIILCSCFLVQKELFNKLMEFSSTIIESKKLNAFDTKHKYRIQGGFMERYFAVWFLLKSIPFISIELQHNFHETKKQNTLINRIIRKIKSL